MSLFWRSWTLVILLISAILAVLILLSTVKFSAILSGFVQERLAVLVQSTQASFRSAAVLGLSLGSVRNGAAILERARQTDPNISAIHIFGPDGNILLSTEANPPDRIAHVGLRAHATSQHRVWRAEADGRLYSGMPILDISKTRVLGGVVIVYPKTGLDMAVKAMGASLALYTIGIISIIAVLALGILSYGLRRLMIVFNGIETAFATLEQEEWRRAAGGRSPALTPVVGFEIDTSALAQKFEAAEKQYTKAGMALAALEPPDEAA